MTLDVGYGFQIASEDDNCTPLLHNELNWSTTDIDAPLSSLFSVSVTDSEILIHIKQYLMQLYLCS